MTLRGDLVSGYLADLAGSDPDSSLAILEEVAADRRMRLGEVDALARSLGLAPAGRSRAAVLAALRRHWFDRLAAAEKARVLADRNR